MRLEGSLLTKYAHLMLDKVRELSLSADKAVSDEAKAELILRSPFCKEVSEVEEAEAKQLANEFLWDPHCKKEYDCLSHLIFAVANFNSLPVQYSDREKQAEHINKTANYIKKAFKIMPSDTNFFSRNISDLAFSVAKEFLKLRGNAAGVWLAFSAFLDNAAAKASLLDMSFFPEDMDVNKVHKMGLLACAFSILLYRFYKTQWNNTTPDPITAYNTIPYRYSPVFKAFGELKQRSNFDNRELEHSWLHLDTDSYWFVLEGLSRCENTNFPNIVLAFLKNFQDFGILDNYEYEKILATSAMDYLSDANKESRTYLFLASIFVKTDTEKALKYLKHPNSDARFVEFLEVALSDEKLYEEALSAYKKSGNKFIKDLTMESPIQNCLEVTLHLLSAAKTKGSPLVFNIFKDFRELKERAKNSLSRDESLSEDVHPLLEFEDVDDRLYVQHALLSCVFYFKQYQRERASVPLLDNFQRFFGVMIDNLFKQENKKIETLIKDLEKIVDKCLDRAIDPIEMHKEFSTIIQNAKTELLAKEEKYPHRKELFKNIESVLKESREYLTMTPDEPKIGEAPSLDSPR